MSGLDGRPALMPDEPLLSFASRTARCYGTDLTVLCHEVGLSRRELATGSGGSAGRLAELTGLDPATLRDRAFAWEGGVWRFKGQLLHRLGVRRATLGVCPSCLREDVAGSPLEPDRAAYVRAHWLAKAVRTCVAHGVELVDVVEPEAPVDMAVHDLARRLAPSLGELGRLSDRARTRAPTDLERYVVDRLHGLPVDGGLADAMPLYAGARTCEMLGAAALFGPKARLRALDDDAWRAAGAVGFDVVSLGAGAVASCLAGLMGAHGVENRNTGPFKVFGLLYAWLGTEDSGPAYEPFRAVLREVVCDTVPLPAGADVLGTRLDRRRVHSLRSAAAETGRSLKGLRRELRSAGVLPGTGGKGAGRLVAIPVDGAARAAQDLGESLPRAEAAARLGATVGDLRRLTKAGLLAPVVTRPGVARSHVRFSAKALDAFLARLGTGVTGVSPSDADMRDVPTAARLANRGLANVTAAIMGGRLRHVVRLPGAEGFRSVLVDVDEVVGASVTGDAGVGVDDVARRLRVTRVTALGLVRDGHLVARRVASPMSRRVVTAVDQRSLAAFTMTYASLSELSNETGVAWGRLKDRLAAGGVTPAFPFDRTRSVVYRRRDVARVLSGNAVEALPEPVVDRPTAPAVPTPATGPRPGGGRRQRR